MNIKNKKILGITASVFIVVLLLSTATAVPLQNAEAIDNTLETRNKTLIERIKTLIPYADESFLIWFLNMFQDLNLNGPVFQMINDATIIEKAWEYKDNATVQSAVLQAKDEINAEINKLPEESRQYVREYFDIDNAFSIEGIIQRILSLRIGHVLEDIQNKLLKAQDPLNYPKFNQTMQGYMAPFLESLYYNGYFEPQTNSSGYLEEMYYPVIDKICQLLAWLSLLWALPLTIAGGLIGMFIACCITIIFFAPITAPLGLYVGFSEMLKVHPEIKEQLMQVLIISGLVGLTILGPFIVLEEMFNGTWFMLGFAYVLDHIALSSILDDGTLTFRNRKPEFLHFQIENPVVKRYQQIHVSYILNDNDELYNGYKNEYGNRDYVQIGVDINGDGVDFWTNLEPPFDGPRKYFSIDGFSKEGVYDIYFVSRDNWGEIGMIVHEKITVTKEKAFMHNCFPMLRMLLERLRNR